MKWWAPQCKTQGNWILLDLLLYSYCVIFPPFFQLFSEMLKEIEGLNVVVSLI